MPSVVFIGKGKVDGQEYDKGNTLDVDEATKSRLIKEGCIESDGGSDCSELQAKLDENNEALKAFHVASKIAEYEAVKVKYPLAEAK